MGGSKRSPSLASGSTVADDGPMTRRQGLGRLVTRRAVEGSVASVAPQTVSLERALQAAPDDPELLGALCRRLALSGEVERAAALLARIPAGPERTLTQVALWLARVTGRARRLLETLEPSGKVQGLARLLQQEAAGMRIAPAVYAACKQAEGALPQAMLRALRLLQPHLGAAVGTLGSLPPVRWRPWTMRVPRVLLAQARAARTWLSVARMNVALGAAARETKPRLQAPPPHPNRRAHPA